MTKPIGCTCLLTDKRWIHDPTCTVHMDAPEEKRVVIMLCADPTSGDVERSAGITYQRCGGGRRIIRKRIGGN